MMIWVVNTCGLSALHLEVVRLCAALPFRVWRAYVLLSGAGGLLRLRRAR